MRIWDIEQQYLCRKHLLGEHRELHGLWNILTQHNNTGGYSHHPETKRWVGKLAALYNRHELLVAEMIKRGFQHQSPLDTLLAVGDATQNNYIDSVTDQENILHHKPCDCFNN